MSKEKEKEEEEEADPSAASGSGEAQNEHRKMAKGKGSYSKKNIRRALWTFVAVVLVLVGVAALIVWLLYRPQKPRFRVVGATIYNLTTTATTTATMSPPAPFMISTTMQFAILTRNPNRRVSIRYDWFSIFVSYRNQKITTPTVLPPLFHQRHSTVALEPTVGGRAVAVSEEIASGLAVDGTYGVVGLRLEMLGRLRWKPGLIFLSRGHHRIHARCDMLVGMKSGFPGRVPLLGYPADCRVDI